MRARVGALSHERQWLLARSPVTAAHPPNSPRGAIHAPNGRALRPPVARQKGRVRTRDVDGPVCTRFTQ